MNWRRGLRRAWVVASILWAVGVFVLLFPQLFREQDFADVLGPNPMWLLPWPSLTTYYVSFFNPGEPLPPGPSAALVAARIGDMLLLMIVPPAAVLGIGRAVGWVARGFRSA